MFDVTWTAGGESHEERCVMLRHPVSSVLESDESDGEDHRLAAADRHRVQR